MNNFNDTFAVESFISWCDEMMIAEESVASMNKEFEKEKKRIDQIHDEIRNCQDVKKQITLYKELSSILKELYSKVNAMEPSIFDKAVGYGATILKTIAPIAATVSTNILLKKLQNATDEKIPGKNIGSLVVGAATRHKVNKLTSGVINPKITKGNILSNIKSMEFAVDNCVKILSNPKYSKLVDDISRDKNYHDNLSQVGFQYDWNNGQSQLCKKIITEIKANFDKLLSKYKIHEIDTTIKSIDYGYCISDPLEIDSDDEWNSFYDLNKELLSIIDNLKLKYKTQLTKLKCEVESEFIDDGLTITVKVE